MHSQDPSAFLASTLHKPIFLCSCDHSARDSLASDTCLYFTVSSCRNVVSIPQLTQLCPDIRHTPPAVLHAVLYLLCPASQKLQHAVLAVSTPLTVLCMPLDAVALCPINI